MSDDAQPEIRADAPVVHVAPDPRGGWLVEAEDRRIISPAHAALEAAIAQARAYAAPLGWRLVVHDQQHPAAGARN